MSDVGDNTSLKPSLTNVDPETFAKAMGQAVWLLTMSKEHQDLPIREIERIVSTPVFLGQFKIYSKGSQPIAFLSWASVSDSVRADVAAGKHLKQEDWRSGDNIIIVDVVSPFSSTETFEHKFMEAVTSLKETQE